MQRCRHMAKSHAIFVHYVLTPREIRPFIFEFPSPPTSWQCIRSSPSSSNHIGAAFMFRIYVCVTTAAPWAQVSLDSPCRPTRWFAHQARQRPQVVYSQPDSSDATDNRKSPIWHVLLDGIGSETTRMDTVCYREQP